jgi:hypothetical protein
VLKGITTVWARWQASLGAFSAWWFQELREAGEALLVRLAPRLVTRTLVMLGPQGGNLWLVRGAERECLTSFTCDTAGAWPDTLQPPAAAETVRNTRAIFALAPDYVLTHKLTLPAAVERDLEQVIGLQLERECPMPLDRVYVDRRAGRRVRNAQKIDVDVLIVQRDRVERLQELAQKWGLRLVRVGMCSETKGVIGNFLHTPEASSLRFTRSDRRLAILAAAFATACVVVTAFHWGYERVKVGHLESDAAPARALVGLMRQPDALDALTILTQDIPKDSWIYDLDISAQWPQSPRIKLSGFTPVATMLISELQSSNHFNEIRLVSAISAGLGSAQDRVQLTARQVSNVGEARGTTGSLIAIRSEP